MSGHHSVDEARDGAALYALGCLRGNEAREFEAHLHAGCAVCAAEVEAFSSVTADLAHAATPLRPRDTVRARVLERAATSTAANITPPGVPEGLLFLRSLHLPWQPSDDGSMEFKRLFEDPQRGHSTQIVRLRPGATYPSHRHADVEELYLLEGDLWVSGVEMRAGDYCRAEPGSIHSDIRTRIGCVFISSCSQHDELLA